MKKYLIILILSIISCNTKSKLVTGIEYRIIKIDTIENIYLINAEKADISIKNTSIIKIASAKTSDKCKKGNLLKVNKIYKFNIESLYPKNFVSHHYLTGITYNGVFVPFEKNINFKRNLFITTDLEGLCYKTKNTK